MLLCWIHFCPYCILLSKALVLIWIKRPSCYTHPQTMERCVNNSATFVTVLKAWAGSQVHVMLWACAAHIVYGTFEGICTLKRMHGLSHQSHTHTQTHMHISISNHVHWLFAPRTRLLTHITYALHTGLLHTLACALYHMHACMHMYMYLFHTYF